MQNLNFKNILKYLCSTDSAYISRVKPATEDEIAGLKSVLPESYKDFLLVMGNDLGGLQPLNAVFDLPHIISAKENYSPPKEYILIGVQNEFPYLDVYFDLTAKRENGAFQIVRFESAEPVEQVFPAFPTLEDMILFTGFEKLKLNKLPFKHSLVPYGTATEEFRKSRMSILKEICFYLELNKLPGMSDQVACYENENENFCLQVYSPNTLSFRTEIASSDKSTLEKCVEIICERLNLKRQYFIG